MGVLTDVAYGMPKEYVYQDLDNIVDYQSLIDVVLTSVEIGFRKPETIGFSILASKLGVSPCDMVFIGDEEKDIRGAQAAGMKAILLSRNKLGNNWGQDATVSTLSEIYDYCF